MINKHHIAWALALVAIAGWSCSQPEPVALLPCVVPAAYTDSTLNFPQLLFADESASLNDRCPVRKVKLNRKLAPLYVNGSPIGFC